MDLTRCNLGKFLGVPTFVATRLHVRKTPDILAAKVGTICRECCPLTFKK